MPRRYQPCRYTAAGSPELLPASRADAERRGRTQGGEVRDRATTYFKVVLPESYHTFRRRAPVRSEREGATACRDTLTPGQDLCVCTVQRYDTVCYHSKKLKFRLRQSFLQEAKGLQSVPNAYCMGCSKAFTPGLACIYCKRPEGTACTNAKGQYLFSRFSCTCFVWPACEAGERSGPERQDWPNQTVPLSSHNAESVVKYWGLCSSIPGTRWENLRLTFFTDVFIFLRRTGLVCTLLNETTLPLSPEPSSVSSP